MSRRRIVLLGSTGSIGTQAIDVIARNLGRFQVVGLAAGGRDVGLLAKQAAALGVGAVAVFDATVVDELRAALAAQVRTADGWDPAAVEIVTGEDAAAELAAMPADVVLNGITGSVGLAPTLAALRAGTTLALANKESLVVGGPLVRAARVRLGQIVPVDSEHSAI
ncbi:MAG: 1-deoxy-D-xylulose-5-phosphate reductoisomerase, partial [Actinobacteria bacterium]|nr:1-deoxy-D-xylulose-5-phosphate reductoisomerase [Actinomycetota bacterium]